MSERDDTIKVLGSLSACHSRIVWFGPGNIIHCIQNFELSLLITSTCVIRLARPVSFAQLVRMTLKYSQYIAKI